MEKFQFFSFLEFLFYMKHFELKKKLRKYKFHGKSSMGDDQNGDDTTTKIRKHISGIRRKLAKRFWTKKCQPTFCFRFF